MIGKVYKHVWKKNKNATVLFLEIMSVCILKTPTLVKLNESGKWDNAVTKEMQFRCAIVILATLILSNAMYGPVTFDYLARIASFEIDEF